MTKPEPTNSVVLLKATLLTDPDVLTAIVRATLQGVLEAEMNQKKLRRLYREEKLQVRRCGDRKRALGTRRLIELPAAENQRWSLDFVSDAFTDGRRFRILAVVDDFTRECLALVPDTLQRHAFNLTRSPPP